MKLKKEFITHDTEDAQVMVSTGKSGFRGMVRSNATAAFIVNCLKTDTDEEKIVAAMTEKYDAPEDVIRADVKKILDTLRSIGALDEAE